MEEPGAGPGAALHCASITAPRRFSPSFALALAGIERHGEELEAMLDEPVAEALGDVALQLLDLLVAELDDAAGLEIDEVVMMIGRHLLVARPAVAEIVARQNVRLLEKTHGPVDGGDADLGVDLIGPAVDRLDIGVIGRVRQHACDDAALLGHLQTLVEAKLFEPRGHSTRHNWRRLGDYNPKARGSLPATSPAGPG